MPVPFLDRIVLTPDGPATWELVEPLTYRAEREQWIIPAGYRTDLATHPRIISWLVPRSGRYTPAAILHDYLITNEYPAGTITAVDLDGVFRRVMLELGVSTARSWLMWAGVRWGSLASGRRAGWLQTAPAVLGISLVALPVLLLGVPGVALGLLLFDVAERLADA